MDEHLIYGGDILAQRPAIVCPPPGTAIVGGTGIFMKKWFRTGKAIVMYLNNGTLQVRLPSVVRTSKRILHAYIVTIKI